MTTFDKREAAFENKFALDEELPHRLRCGFDQHQPVFRSLGVRVERFERRHRLLDHPAMTPERGRLLGENLALERIMQAVRADSSDKHWLVTGQVTEYRGRNYILLERVSLAPRTAQ